MRINLRVPFAQKEAAKELGARWDAARKIWYVIDPKCLEDFSDWMPQPEAASGPTQAAASVKAQISPGVLTGPQRLQPLCACPVLPWDTCPHSASI